MKACDNKIFASELCLLALNSTVEVSVLDLHVAACNVAYVGCSTVSIQEI